jgi:DNA-directed RNA polymerase specialized sigma24 family protein
MSDYEHDMTYAEIAEELYLHKNTIPEIEARALNKLREILNERGISADNILER